MQRSGQLAAGAADDEPVLVDVEVDDVLVELELDESVELDDVEDSVLVELDDEPELDFDPEPRLSVL